MKYCSVKTCSNNSSCANIAFFSFPRTEQHAEWISFTQKEGLTPAQNSKICSDNFSPHLISGRILKKGAIPTHRGVDQLAASMNYGKLSSL